MAEKRLLRSKRFLPFFLTQALGAFNDNVFKQAIVLAILFKISFTDQHLGAALGPDILVNLCALLFILPFFLFSALGGQLGEVLAKDMLIRRLKWLEVGLMVVGGYAIWAEQLLLMLCVLFMMGLQSALFGPVKYSILPEHLAKHELMQGNAWVELGTFLAILFGTVVAGILLAQPHYGMWVGVVVIAVALLGLCASYGIPQAPSHVQLIIDHHLWRQTKSILRIAFSQERTVRYALIANAWFWFLGATYLTQIPNYAKAWLHGDEMMVSIILTLFSVGIAVGSVVCARLSRGRVDARFVCVGAIGLTCAGLLLYWHSGYLVYAPNASGVSFIQDSAVLWVVLDIIALGVFGGFYIVPLYALIQSRTAQQFRTRVIAANNILNALFMVIAALVAMLLLGVLGLDIPALFGVVALLGGIINGWLFYRAPEFRTGKSQSA